MWEKLPSEHGKVANAEEFKNVIKTYFDKVACTNPISDNHAHHRDHTRACCPQAIESDPIDWQPVFHKAMALSDDHHGAKLHLHVEHIAFTCDRF